MEREKEIYRKAREKEEKDINREGKDFLNCNFSKSMFFSNFVISSLQSELLEKSRGQICYSG